MRQRLIERLQQRGASPVALAQSAERLLHPRELGLEDLDVGLVVTHWHLLCPCTDI